MFIARSTKEIKVHDKTITYRITVIKTFGIASPDIIPVIAFFNPSILQFTSDFSRSLHTSSWFTPEDFSVPIKNVQFLSFVLADVMFLVLNC